VVVAEPDLRIASIALSRGLIFMTRNVRSSSAFLNSPSKTGSTTGQPDRDAHVLVKDDWQCVRA